MTSKKNAPTWVTPISVNFKGYRVWEMPPNNQGIAALEMLRILEPYDLKAMGQNSAAYLHLLIEAKKLAYADLAKYVGDADHLTLTPAQMLSDAFIAERRSHIDLKKAATRVDPGPERVGGETIYLTVADKDGNMVSFINSNFDEFGSGIVVPGTGFVLHDRGMGFTVTDGPAEHRGAGQAALPHADSGIRHEAGGESRRRRGGRRAVHELRPDGGLDAGAGARAVPAQSPRVRHERAGGDGCRALPAHAGTRVVVESVIPDGVIAALRALGHDVSTAPAVAVRRKPGDHQARARLRRRVRPAQGRPRGGKLMRRRAMTHHHEPDGIVVTLPMNITVPVSRSRSTNT